MAARVRGHLNRLTDVRGYAPALTALGVAVALHAVFLRLLGIEDGASSLLHPWHRLDRREHDEGEPRTGAPQDERLEHVVGERREQEQHRGHERRQALLQILCRRGMIEMHARMII